MSDFTDDFNNIPAEYNPVLDTPAATTYPFVVSAVLTDASGGQPDGARFGNQETTWTIKFNRDMDTSTQPLVTFGPAEPFTDFSVPGDWSDARTWVGKFTFSPVTGDGWQNIRVVGAVAASNPWLVTGDDSERFRFELITSGVEALNLQASGERDQVVLSWTQDDFELLHGFNLYRSLAEDGTYERVNTATINKSDKTFVDTTVAPGVPHYYYFTVVSEKGESGASNIALATPDDTIAPSLSHTPETIALVENNFTIRATISDNVKVASAVVYYRIKGESTWNSLNMISVDDSSAYSGTIEANAIAGETLEYYIQVGDGTNTVYYASAEIPQEVIISISSNTDSDGDGVVNSLDAFPFNGSETSDLDGDGVGDNSDPDKDGDGVENALDKFPDNQFESADTDGDGLGNNSDNDDDNDGTMDYQDRFPLDARGHSDTDSDGLPDEWEDTNGLDSSNRLDADFDADRDGFTNSEEFKNDTDPTVSNGKSQIVVIAAPDSVARGKTAKVTLSYDTSDANPNLTGLGIRVHFSSRIVESVSFDNVLNLDLAGLDSSFSYDSSNYDNDWNTDVYVALAWAAPSTPSWPGALPKKLVDINLNIKEQYYGSASMPIRVTASATSAGYRLSANPASSTLTGGSFDIDGDEKIQALTDGLLIMRSMFGFGGEQLIAGATTSEATRTYAADIESHIAGLTSQMDVDEDDKVEPLTDGLLIVRYLFGFRGESLISRAVGTNAKRKTASEIEAYLQTIIPSAN